MPERQGISEEVRPAHGNTLALVEMGASCDRDMNVSGWGLHPLSDDLKGHWAGPCRSMVTGE